MDNGLPKIGQGTTLKIGKSTYNAYDIANFKQETKEVNTITGMENVPRNIQKELINESGKIQTNVFEQKKQESVPINYNKARWKANNKIETKRIQYNESRLRVIKSSSNAKYVPNILNNVVIQGMKKSDEDDLGVQGIGNASQIGYSTFKVAQMTTPVLENSIKKIGKGTWEIGLTTGLTGITVATTIGKIHKSQFIPLSKDSLEVWTKQARETGLLNTRISNVIVNRIQTVQNNVKKIKTEVSKTKDSLYHNKMVIKRVINGSIKVKVSYNSLQEIRQKVKVNAIKSKQNIGKVVKGTAESAVLATYKATNKGIPTAKKIVSVGLTESSKRLEKSDDVGVQGVGNAIEAGHKGIKTSLVTMKASKQVIKTSIKKGKNIGEISWKSTSYIKNKGLKAAWEQGRKKITQKSISMGKQVVSSVVNSIKIVGVKFIIPILLICAITVLTTGAITTPIMATASIFSGIFGTSEGNEYDIREYLSNTEYGVPALKRAFLYDLEKQMNESEKKYDIVRFLANTGGNATSTTIAGEKGELIGEFRITAYCPCEICNGQWVGSPTASGTMPQADRTIAVDPSVIPLGTKVFFNNHVYIAEDTGSAIKGNRIDLFVNTHQEALNWGVQYLKVYSASSNPQQNEQNRISAEMPTDEQIINMIQPIFNAIILMDYDLNPSEEEVQQLLKDIFDSLFVVTKTTSKEYCGQDLDTGIGTVITHSCGKIHALVTCPNKITGKHKKYTCDDCCYYYCSGHEEIIQNEDGTTTSEITYCNGCKVGCNGYAYCGGHKVITYNLSIEGVYKLIAKYFTDPINELANLQNRTKEEEERLQSLKDYYEICMEYMKQVSTQFGGGLTMDDLSGVKFQNGDRKGCQEIIDLALSQVGQQGGQPYWSYYGFASRVEWCACFVHWCMRTSGYGQSYPTTSNNAYCQTVADWFKANGRWGDKNYNNLVAGDTIFFDWQQDGHTDHIGLVIGRDQNKIYTVEGNSGDAVKVKSYAIGSSVIYGFGLMNY